jgi:hypothetical protein
MSNIAIRAEGLSKRYKVGKQEKYRTLRDTLTQCVTNPFKRKPNGNSQGEEGPFENHRPDKGPC